MSYPQSGYDLRNQTFAHWRVLNRDPRRSSSGPLYWRLTNALLWRLTTHEERNDANP